MPRPQGLSSFLAPHSVGARAAVWAADAHAGQARQADGAPFLLHPLEVALLLHQAGCPDDVIAAGILHDVAEKGAATLDEVREAFGPAIGAMVAVLTEDPGIAGYDERKAALRDAIAAAGDDALSVFAADKLAQARELRVAAVADAMSAREAASKRAHYLASLELLERRLPGRALTEALRFELMAQEHVPALAWVAPTPADTPVAS
jgi:(p)ppGpp synthase/HD superfamily hydrolase